MSPNEVVVDGTLRPDGTLELDQKPGLSPGRVRILIQSTSTGESSQRGLAGVIDAIHQSQRARAFQGRTADEIDAGLRDGEDVYEQRLRALRSQTVSSPPAGDR